MNMKKVAKKFKTSQIAYTAIKALTTLVDRLSLSVDWENGPERRLKTVLTSCNFSFDLSNNANLDQTPFCGIYQGLHCLQKSKMSQSWFYI